MGKSMWDRLKRFDCSGKAWWQFLSYLLREYSEKGCRQQAAALTYMTLFAVVPLLTVIFTMFSLFPAFENMSETVQSFLFKYMLPDSGLEVQEYIEEFTQQARSLTLAGVSILVITAFLMIKNIETTFNVIWGVKSTRRGVSSFLLYWAILSLGPLLLGVGLAMSTYVLSLQLFVDEYDPLGIVPIIFSTFPWLLTATAFTLLFAAVPNCKVPVKHAFAGGFLTAVCFELFKDLFGWIVAHTTFTAVYGAFAMAPLFLMWIYILWMIVLVGALFVWALSAYKIDTSKAVYPDLIATLLAMWIFHQRQLDGRPVIGQEVLDAGVGVEQWQHIRDGLLNDRIITLTQSDDFVLARDMSHLTLNQLANAIGRQAYMPKVDDKLASLQWFKSMTERLESVDQHREGVFNVTMDQVFETIDSGVKSD